MHMSRYLFSVLVLTLMMLHPARIWAQDDPDPTRFAESIEAFQSADRSEAPPDHPIVFVGSSSIRNWPTSKSFPSYDVVNRGFGGSHISDVNYYAEPTVLKYDPRAIVFYAGDNDIAGGKSPEQVLGDYRTFVQKVHERHPGTPIIFLPIKPSLSRWEMWPEMKRANSMIRRFSKKHSALFYVDTATPMLDEEGRPRASLFVDDGLHMNARGYAVWNCILRPELESILSRSAATRKQ